MSKCTPSSQLTGPTFDTGGARVSDPNEIQVMVRLLEARHGVHAADMAEFFVTANELKGAPVRVEAWSEVADRIRLRERLRIQVDVDASAHAFPALPS